MYLRGSKILPGSGELEAPLKNKRVSSYTIAPCKTSPNFLTPCDPFVDSMIHNHILLWPWIVEMIKYEFLCHLFLWWYYSSSNNAETILSSFDIRNVNICKKMTQIRLHYKKGVSISKKKKCNEKPSSLGNLNIPRQILIMRFFHILFLNFSVFRSTKLIVSHLYGK